MAETSATAEGELGRTPLAHQLVYALEHRLTGALFLTEPGGATHVVRIVKGAPVKVRPGDGYALLGEMLVEAGAIDQATLDAALATKGLLGDVLLLAGRIERDALEQVAEKQFLRRMVRLFELPPETTYRYCEGHDELAEHGGDPAGCDPVAVLWAGLRAHAESSAMMEGTLALLGEAPMRLHAAATVARFGLEGVEVQLHERLLAQPATQTELATLAPAEIVRRFVYALLITRQLELGAASGSSTGPLGAGDGARASMPGPQPTSSITKVAKMQLRSHVHREGAAAPDLPGDGERVPVMPVARAGGRRSAKSDAGDAPRSDDAPPTTRSTQPDSAPVSSVKPIEEAPSSSRDSGVQPIDPIATVAPTSQPSRGSTPAETSSLAGRTAAPEADDLLDSLSVDELIAVAKERLAAKDPGGALGPCDAARRAAPDDPDVVALTVWVRSQVGGADVKALRLDLDELLRAHDDHVPALFYRAMLRKRLNEGAQHDLRRVLELEPEHEGASRELAAYEARQPGKERPSLFGRLFKR